ncbi:MAG: excinuclease ABC subunit UvrA [Clostridiales bacterium]|nr:excinuclease ABC subunit UvrA [Clostridiales bacterium]
MNGTNASDFVETEMREYDSSADGALPADSVEITDSADGAAAADGVKPQYLSVNTGTRTNTTDKKQFIRIRGANEHNLKGISLDIPRNQFVVFTGLSGSGKSSLAFDTIYAEGQRRYMESLSSYARQFLGQMEKPDVESIEGLPPAISIDQKTTNRNPRSTVGTVTEIYDYFRLLYARIGIPHCPKCGREIKKQSVDQMVDQIMALPERTRIQLLAPVVRGRKGEHVKLLEQAKRSGYVRVRIDGNMYDLSEEIKLEKNIKHNIEIVVDRLVVKPGIEKRLTDSMETVLQLADGLGYVDTGDGELISFSQSFSCPDCNISIEEIEPRSFSFNNPFGACPECTGLGYKMEFDIDLMIPDKSLSIMDGAIVVNGWQSCTDPSSFTYALLTALAKEYQFDLSTPFEQLRPDIQHMLVYGTDGRSVKVHYKGQRGVGVYDVAFDGLIRNVEQRYRETSSDYTKQEYESFMRITPCKTCRGQRLKPSALAVTVGGKNIHEITSMSVGDLQKFLADLTLTQQQTLIGAQILKEIRARIGFLVDVGLDYLSLSRATGTLSGGEAQRIRLATQIGSGLVGVAYILDEPSIGLHQRDNDKLLRTLNNLKDLGNTLIVVEHDEDTMYAADYIVDIGPGAGEHGGKVVAAGTVEDLKNCPASITGAYLSHRLFIPVPETRRTPTGWLEVRGAQENNLKNINVKIPLGVMTCVTGVSGSGKSSLINEILYKRLAKDLNRARTIPGKHRAILGIGQLDKVINIDQSPIGRTPRSNPATYTGVFDMIRDLFASTADAKARGYKKGRFSFNIKGGRCEACAGDGILKIEMHFLPDVYVPCEVCHGKRYNRETLDVKYKGKSIYDVLDMTVEEALKFFEHLPLIRRKIETLYDVGLSYIKLGQPSTTLSGGEAQRIKLATELSRRSTGKTVYILDEPTTGLHFADVHKLVDILHRLAEGGNTVIVIEHNLDVIKTADYIIDLGPEGGDRGGTVIAEGTPEEVAQNPISYTGQYIAKYLKENQQ